MHTVVEAYCTGCELCVPACPVDCIVMENATGAATGWAAWSQTQADQARDRYRFSLDRRGRAAAENDQRLEIKAAAKIAELRSHSLLSEPAVQEKKRAVIEAALARARAKRGAAKGEE